ncbi:hypothetical protein NMY22_g1842 [Coprinellus aureogranulatus]|nr:hypothetical protein NMY22_g1842 [Coprinellus aureogranulatus]
MPQIGSGSSNRRLPISVTSPWRLPVSPLAVPKTRGGSSRMATRHHPYLNGSPSSRRERKTKEMLGDIPNSLSIGGTDIKQEELEQTVPESPEDIAGGFLGNSRVQCPRVTRRRVGLATTNANKTSTQRKANTEAGDNRHSPKIAAEIEELKRRVIALQRAESSLKARLRNKSEAMKDTKGELQEARTECLKAEEALDEKEREVETLQREADRYRGWWLSEYYSLKVVLGMMPYRKDVEAMASSAKDRYRAYASAIKQREPAGNAAA